MSYIGNEPIVSATRTITEITATAGQTVFTAVGGYTVGKIDVKVNGAELSSDDFTATNGTTVTLTTACTAGDSVKLIAWGTFTSSSSYSQAESDNTFVRRDSSLLNRIINGDMRIDQRNNGASYTAPVNTNYHLDRWRTYASQGSKISIQQNAGSGSLPSGFSAYLGVTSLAATTFGSADAFVVEQSIEGLNIADLDFGSSTAKSITLSFWVFSSLTGSFGAYVKNGNDSRSYPFSYTINSANTWEQKFVTVPGDTAGTWVKTNAAGMCIGFCLGTGSTYVGTANTWQTGNYVGASGQVQMPATNGAVWRVTGVDLRKGSYTTAPTFDMRSYGTELQLCQRYYEKWLQTDQNTVGFCYASNNLNTYNQFLVEKRATPTLTRNGTFTAYVNGGGNTMTYSAYYGSTKAININWTGGGITAGQAFAWSSQTNPQLEFSAEL